MDYRYWDSVTFLGWLAEETDKVPDCRPVIEAAEGGSVTLVTSALTCFLLAVRTGFREFSYRFKAVPATRLQKISTAINPAAEHVSAVPGR
jgi:hypothetical protein